METSSQPPQPQGTQTKEELDLEIIDVPESSEDSSIRHAWLWHILLRVQRVVNFRTFRLIQFCFTLLLALIATMLLQEGNAVTARSLLEESLVISREIGIRWSTAQSLCVLARAVASEGDNTAALFISVETHSCKTGYVLNNAWHPTETA